jgi:hypothetical protein
MGNDLFRDSILGATDGDWLLSLRAPHPSKFSRAAIVHAPPPPALERPKTAMTPFVLPDGSCESSRRRLRKHKAALIQHARGREAVGQVVSAACLPCSDLGDC